MAAFNRFAATVDLQAGVYFTEVNPDGHSKYVPRSVQVDLEAGVCNRVCRPYRVGNVEGTHGCSVDSRGTFGALVPPEHFLDR